MSQTSPIQKPSFGAAASAYIVLLLCVFLVCAPLLLMISASLKTEQGLVSATPTIFPESPNLDSFSRLSKTKFWSYLGNSLTVALLSSAISLFVGATFSFNISKMKGIQGLLFSSTSLFMYMFAPIMLMIPYFILLSKAKLTNSIWGMVIAHVSFCLPFCIWTLRDFFRSVPDQLSEMASADGMTAIESFWRVYLPAISPGLFATGVFAFILSWNEYVFASILVERDSIRTLPVGVEAMFSTSYVDWGAIMAAGVWMLLPAIVIVLIVHRQIQSGWMKGWQ